MLTVSVCTWNRASLLERCLTHIANAEPPTGPWELNVVDNNSTDDTAQVLARFRDRLPLKAIFEPKAGTSNARNAAIANARGEWMIWTDDDVLVDRHWLTAYEFAIRAYPDTAFMGGVITPVFEGGAPPWLREIMSEVHNVFAFRDLGPDPVVIDAPEMLPYGANYAIRSDVQKAHSFDTNFGRYGVTGTIGEETQALVSALSAGHTGMWVPGARVEHWIPRHRQTVRYLRTYYQVLGRTEERRSAKTKARHLFGRPRWLVRQAFEQELRFRIARLGGSPRRWVMPMIRASLAWGALREYS